MRELHQRHTVTISAHQPHPWSLAVVHDHRTGASDRGPVERHGHDCFELVVVRSGTGIQCIEDRTYPILAGDCYVMQQGDVHHYAESQDLRIVNVLFTADLLPSGDWQELVSLPGLHPFLGVPHRKHRHKLALPPPHDHEVLRRCDRLETELQRDDPGARLAAIAAFLQLMLAIDRLAQAFDPVTSEGPQDQRLGACLQYIHQHLDEPIRLQDLARVSGWSPNHCSARFQDAVGLRPVQYIGKLRVDRARQLLDDTDRSITDIALSVGFEDISHFGKQFKAATGYSPRAYRGLGG